MPEKSEVLEKNKEKKANKKKVKIEKQVVEEEEDSVKEEPIDSDEDGVPDYLDKEPQTKKGAIVNESGETLTKKMIADKQKAYEAETFERSRMFNASPSLEYLKEIESMAAETKKNNTNIKIEIPQALKPADKNNDGFISANEIKDAIDKFFEGDSNFTVEKLNDLIDFFFQQ